MDLKDKREYLFRKQRGKTYLSKYLEELNAILDTAKGSYQVLSLEETDRILQRSAESINKEKVLKYQLEFDHKEEFLIDCMIECNRLLSGMIYLFTGYSEDCGLAVVDTLMMLKPDFSFTSEHAGLISIISGDLSNKILLDFYEENNEYFLEIEIYGDLWGSIEPLYA